jgi:AcrR family transcriptional regulator
MARTVDTSQVAERRARILDALEESILELGFPRINFKDLAARSGLSQGLLNYYFADKTEMILSLQWRLLEQYNDALWGITHGDAPASERLATLFDVVLTESPQVTRTVRIFLQLESEALTNPLVAHGMQLYLKGFHEAVTRVLQAFPWWQNADAKTRRVWVTFVIAAIKGSYVQDLFLPGVQASAATRKFLEPLVLRGELPGHVKSKADRKRSR